MRPKKSRLRAFAIAVLLLASGCGDSKPTPAAPSPPPTGGGSTPVVALEIAVDAGGPADAIAQLSDVRATATSSAPGPLTFSIDFGDGTTAAGPSATHAYGLPGAYTITSTVTDAQGRRASDARQITVKDLTGRWFHAGYVTARGRVEVRRLTIASQDGLTVRGVYQVTGDADRTFSATLTKPRSISFAIAGGAGLEGTIPGQLDTEESWSLAMRGDGVDGQRLAFRPILGQPTEDAPDAVLRLRFDSFDAPRPLAAVSPIQIDGSTSRGSGLSYFIEFGDGEVSTDARAVHIVDRSPRDILTARLTVVDRFARADSESASYQTFAIGYLFLDGWIGRDASGKLMRLECSGRNGANYIAKVVYTDAASGGIVGTGVASLSGERDIRIVFPSIGVEFRGTVVLTLFAERMILTQFGGPGDGRTWTLTYDDGPG
jgi:hypothetical protein